jgi:hypothetical protein
MLALPLRRVKPRTVALVLAAWVFALAAGIANACVLHDRHTGRDGPVGSSAHAPAHPEGSASVCKDARDASASTGVKTAAPDSGNPHPGLATVQTRSACLNPASAALVERSLDDGVLAGGPPAAIRFLRLRL